MSRPTIRSRWFTASPSHTPDTYAIASGGVERGYVDVGPFPSDPGRPFEFYGIGNVTTLAGGRTLTEAAEAGLSVLAHHAGRTAQQAQQFQNTHSGGYFASSEFTSAWLAAGRQLGPMLAYLVGRPWLVGPAAAVHSYYMPALAGLTKEN